MCFLCFLADWRLDTLHRGLRKLGHNQQLPERAEREGKTAKEERERQKRARERGKDYLRSIYIYI